MISEMMVLLTLAALLHHAMSTARALPPSFEPELGCDDLAPHLRRVGPRTQHFSRREIRRLGVREKRIFGPTALAVPRVRIVRDRRHIDDFPGPRHGGRAADEHVSGWELAHAHPKVRSALGRELWRAEEHALGLHVQVAESVQRLQRVRLVPHRAAAVERVD